jgi:hypothetical protein
MRAFLEWLAGLLAPRPQPRLVPIPVRTPKPRRPG